MHLTTSGIVYFDFRQRNGIILGSIQILCFKQDGTTLLGEIGRKMTEKLKRSKRSVTVSKQTDSIDVRQNHELH